MKADPDFLPMAVWYCGGRARAPMISPITPASRAEWAADLRQIRALGFNAVRAWINWEACEPRPGEFHFENLQLLGELAQAEGLRLLVQVYAELTPAWLAAQFADAAFEAQSGERAISQGVPGVCTDHPGVKEAFLRFYRAAAEVAKQLPAFFAWDLWSEPHIVNWTIVSHIPKVQYCYCPHTRARFQAWLSERYGSLDRLAETWARRFASWDQIEPPRFGTILTYTDFVDWKLFTYEKMADDLRVRAEAVKAVDPEHAVTSHAAVPSGLTSPLSEWAGYGCTDDFLMADTVDFYGLSLYPKHSFPQHHWERWKIEYALEFSRSANRRNGGFYVGELQAGPGARGVVVGDPITPDDHRLWIWSCLAHGAKAINLYAYHPMTSGYEAGGYGLIHPDGAVTPRAEMSGRIAQIVTEHMDLFVHARPVAAKVAIVYNTLAQLAGGEQACGPTSLHTDSLAGYQRVFADHGVPVDFIHRRDLERGAVEGYRLVILPHPLMLTAAAAKGLRDFVAEGGHLLAEARAAWSDERGHVTDAIPGLGLSEVFGAREDEVRLVEHPEFVITAADHPALTDLAIDTVLQGAHFAESLRLLEGAQGEVLATWLDGSPAIFAHRFGSGAAILAGTFLGMAQRLRPTAEKEQFILNLLRWAGIEPRVEVLSIDAPEPPPTVRFQSLPDGSLLLFALSWSGIAEWDLAVKGYSPEDFCHIHDLINGYRDTLPTDPAGRIYLAPCRQSPVSVYHLSVETQP